MIIIGLTGGIGSGKSTVAELFAAMDIAIIDTDVIARELVKPHQPAYKEIIAQFGDDILLPDQQLDRTKLKQRIINNDNDHLILENILHPRIQASVEEQIKSVSDHYCIVVIPLLVEKANYPMLDRVLVVDAPVKQQIERISQRDNLDRASIEKLIALQASREQRLAIADDVILNQQGLSELTAATKQMHDKYMKL